VFIERTALPLRGKKVRHTDPVAQSGPSRCQKSNRADEKTGVHRTSLGSGSLAMLLAIRLVVTLVPVLRKT
jgi:hypothetical protein